MPKTEPVATKDPTRGELLNQAPYFSEDQQKNEYLLPIIRQQLKNCQTQQPAD